MPKRQLPDVREYWMWFWRGVASIFDLCPRMDFPEIDPYEPPKVKTPEERNREAGERIAGYWRNVGGYLWGAMGRFDDELKRRK